MQHYIYHGDKDHGLAALRQGFIVLGQASVTAKPREGALYDPAFGQDDKPFYEGSSDDLDRTAEQNIGPVNQESRVAAVRPDELQARETPTHAPDQQLRPVAILHICRMHDQGHDQAERIHDDMALAARDFLARIEATIPPFSAVFTDWLSMMPADGVGLRPALRRTCSRRRS
jgi:hypothetical protein